MYQTYYYYPSPLLAPYVSHYVFFDFGVDAPATSFNDFPRTAMDMLFVFDGAVQIVHSKRERFLLDKCSFISLFDTAYSVEVSKRTTALHIRFKANGIYPLSIVPLHETLNGHLPLLDLLGKNASELYNQMGELPNAQAKIDLFEAWLLPFYHNDKLHFRLEHALQLIEQHKGLISVKALSDQLNTNYKSLDRWFQKKVGFTPKKYIQLTRFKHILDELETQKEIDWMQLVVDYDFYDQAHFIKSFRQFANISPTAYLKL